MPAQNDNRICDNVPASFLTSSDLRNLEPQRRDSVTIVDWIAKPERPRLSTGRLGDCDIELSPGEKDGRFSGQDIL